MTVGAFIGIPPEVKIAGTNFARSGITRTYKEVTAPQGWLSHSNETVYALDSTSKTHHGQDVNRVAYTTDIKLAKIWEEHGALPVAPTSAYVPVLTRAHLFDGPVAEAA